MSNQDQESPEKIRIVEMNMMDKRKYYPMALCSSVMMRFIQYPLTLVRTRLQMQHGKDVYKGTFDALVKIRATEGIRGLYRGFGVHSIQSVNSLIYISVYENVRQTMINWNQLLAFKNKNYISSCVAGFSASFAAQTIAVPSDIVSQHMMLLGQKRKGKPNVPLNVNTKLESLQRIHLKDEVKHQRVDVVKAIIKEVHKKGGLAGFYKGYFISLFVYGLGSSLWWPFYEYYANNLFPIVPDFVPKILVHGTSASMAGMTSVTITNAMELVRVRMQVSGCTFMQTLKSTWKEEGFRIFTKSLTARIINVVPISFLIMTSYSTIKYLSLKEEYTSQIHW